MTRQRVRPSLKKSVFDECPTCNGTGVVKTESSMSIEVIRLLLLAAQRPDTAHITLTVSDDVAAYLNNRKRREITRLEDAGKMSVQIIGAKGVSPEHLVIECTDGDSRRVDFNWT